jgi:hypothetical protein
VVAPGNASLRMVSLSELIRADIIAVPPDPDRALMLEQLRIEPMHRGEISAPARAGSKIARSCYYHLANRRGRRFPCVATASFRSRDGAAASPAASAGQLAFSRPLVM